MLRVAPRAATAPFGPARRREAYRFQHEAQATCGDPASVTEIDGSATRLALDLRVLRFFLRLYILYIGRNSIHPERIRRFKKRPRRALPARHGGAGPLSVIRRRFGGLAEHSDERRKNVWAAMRLPDFRTPSALNGQLQPHYIGN